MSARICRHRTAQRAPGQSGGTLAGGSCGCCARARGHAHGTRVCSMKAWRFVSSPRPRAGWRATPRNDRASAGSRCSPAPGPTLLPPVHPMCAGLSPAIWWPRIPTGNRQSRRVRVRAARMPPAISLMTPKRAVGAGTIASAVARIGWPACQPLPGNSSSTSADRGAAAPSARSRTKNIHPDRDWSRIQSGQGTCGSWAARIGTCFAVWRRAGGLTAARAIVL